MNEGFVNAISILHFSKRTLKCSSFETSFS